MATQAINNNPGFCAGFMEGSRTVVNSLIEKTKNLTASAGDVLGKVWAAVTEFFSSIGQTLGQWFSVASESLVAAKNRFFELPRETQIVAGVTLGASLLAGIVLGRCCGSRATPAQGPAQAAAAQGAPQGAAAQAAQANG